MAVINLDADQLKSLNTEISSLDQTLLQSYLPQLEEELGQIRSNVQNAELNSILNTISSQFGGVKSALSTELPKLETFLDEQIQSYATTEQAAADAVNAVVNRMQQLVGNTTVTGVAGAVAAGGVGTAAGAATAQAGYKVDPEKPLVGPEKQQDIYANEGESNDSSSEGSGNSIYKNMGNAAWGGAGAGAAIGTAICPGIGTAIGAGVGAVAGAAVPVVADLAGKAVVGITEVGKGALSLVGKLGSGLEKLAGDW